MVAPVRYPDTVPRVAALVIHPRQTLSFDQFCATDGPAVALDGYVVGPTRCDATGQHASFDHHAGVDRATTPATCQQVAAAIRDGVALLVDDHGRPRPQLLVHVNDPDPDVALSWWLLNHPSLWDHPVVRRLVDLEGRLDASGGTIADADIDWLEVLAWVIEPWATARRSIPSLDAEGMAGVIDAVCVRIDELVAGRPGQLELTTSYELLHEVGPVWAICEHHPLARAAAVAEGARALVSVLPGPHPTTGTVTLCKADSDVPVDLELVYADLNLIEGRDLSDLDRWGGSDLVGGSPRSAGTHLSLDDIVDAVLARYGDDPGRSPVPVRG